MSILLSLFAEMVKGSTLVILCAFLVACGAPRWGTPAPVASVTATGYPIEGNQIPTETPSRSEVILPTDTSVLTDTPLPSLTPDTRLSPDNWKDWPVVPTVSPKMKKVYQDGLAIGNNPNEFSKIGDGEISTVWFLTQYDTDPSNLHLGSHTELEPVIEHFAGSFGRIGMAAGRGFNTTIILGPVPAGTKGCNLEESRLDCELRVYHPSFALLSLGTNQIWEPQVYQPGMQKIIERLLKADVVPILSTKADNKEGNFRINTIIAQLAYQYDLPVWNFWRVVQPLPAHGLQSDQEHLTYAYSDFSNPINFQFAWPWRNLTALQTLDSVYRGVTSQP